MGTEICKNCNTNNNILTEKNLSNDSFIGEENNFKQINYFINKNKTSRFESNISTKFINNENENNISNYDNPLYNTSLEESMNLGNCYIGTNKNNTKIKPYNPENSMHTIMNKKRLSIEPNPNPKEFPFEKKMNQTLKNFNKKNIRYNLLFNTGNNGKEEKNIFEKRINYNNSNRKNNSKYNNMGFFNNTAQNNIKIDKSLENISNLIQKINTNNNKNKTKKIFDLSDKVPETYDEEVLDKLRNIYLKYNLKIFKKIISKIMKNEKEKNEINNINGINQFLEEYENFNNGFNLEELDVNLIPEKKHIFIGSKMNNLKNGYGMEIFKNFNAYYFGQFINGKRLGFGKYIMNNKNANYKYEGEVDNIHATGYGRYVNNETGIRYEGEWKNSLKNGIGIETYKNNIYKGSFLNGKRNGIGEYYWEKDVYYIGEWSDNYMNGEGIYYFNKNAWYEGSFKNNKIEGFGILNVKSSKIYVGFFKNDYKDGFGIKIWDNDKKAYVGFWKDNKQDGFGKLFKKDKIKYGIYRDGNIINEVEDNAKINKIFKDINEYFSLLFDLRNYNEVKAKVYEYMNK